MCPTLCSTMDYSFPCSSVHGILQARILEWVAIFFSRGSSRPRDQISIAGRFFTNWATKEAQKYDYYSRQGYWSGLPCPPPEDLPNPEIEPMSPTLQVDSLPSEPNLTYRTLWHSWNSHTCNLTQDIQLLAGHQYTNDSSEEPHTILLEKGTQCFVKSFSLLRHIQ